MFCIWAALCLANLLHPAPQGAIHLPMPSSGGLPSARPFLAIWHVGGMGRAEDSHLRVAFWHDGKVMFAIEPATADSKLHQGWLTKDRVARLKKDLAATGALQGPTSAPMVTFDVPYDHALVTAGSGKRVLRCSEEDLTGAARDAAARRFARTWHALVRLARAALPRRHRVTSAWCARPPDSWR